MELLEEYIKQSRIYNYNELNRRYIYAELIGRTKTFHQMITMLRLFLLYIQCQGTHKELLYKQLLKEYSKEDIEYIRGKIIEDSEVTEDDMFASTMYDNLYNKKLVREWNYF